MSSAYLREYKRLGHLGKGANAKVYKVQHIKLGYIRAVRELTDYIKDENDRLYRTFLDECKILLKLGNGGHPNIVRIYQPRLLQNTALVEMDYVKGCDLNDFLIDNNGFIPFQEFRRFILDISSALAYCHVDIYEFCMDKYEDNLTDDPADGSKALITDEIREKLIKKYGITHNDIHSRNVMRKYDGSFILLDFGLAIQNGKAVRSSSRRDGAVEYRAPEKWDNDTVISEQSDVYSFGILMYEMLAGKVPFPFEQDKYSNELQALNELSRRHTEIPPPAIEPLRRRAFENAHPGETYIRDYPEWLEQVIMKCLEKRPEMRYANAKELNEDLKRQFAETDDSETVRRLKLQNANLNERVDALAQGESKLNELINNLAKQLSVSMSEAENARAGNTRLKYEINRLKRQSINNDNDVSRIKSRKWTWMAACFAFAGLFGYYCFKYYETGGNHRPAIVLSQTAEQMPSPDENAVPADYTESKYDIEMVYVEGGAFIMGSPESEFGRDATTELQRRVTLSSFYIGRYEVTQEQWTAVMRDNPSFFMGDNLPVESVSWNDVQDFIRELNLQTNEHYRLPTEAEWEYAARGGKRSAHHKYSGSNDIDNVAWYADNSDRRTHEVGTKMPNELNIYDMSGNVWEWCQDWFGSYGSEEQTNPQGAASGSNRVLRGGSWFVHDRFCRSANRFKRNPDYRDFYYGFRLAHSL
ncbi:MAG: SUMF1/EgtB/PvdO family nonheme iron enzyme [Prevotella sp.]|jgi:formylglycine-generating enzyme required for sulfatase activity/tRNA A-37 threonylcarbamoyl transferase component Bud32|nr:SUMF1/EgtB/PvdO family nonheme iron enzyme [Prevotella sp.]